jgi:hypothetical protein
MKNTDRFLTVVEKSGNTFLDCQPGCNFQCVVINKTPVLSRKMRDGTGGLKKQFQLLPAATNSNA